MMMLNRNTTKPLYLFTREARIVSRRPEAQDVWRTSVRDFLPVKVV